MLSVYQLDGYSKTFLGPGKPVLKMDCKCLILSAGLGTRLGDLTKDIPKVMLPVGGKPVLEHLVNHLYKYGVFEIMVNLHYKPNMIKDYFGDRLRYSYEPILLGETNTVINNRWWFDKPTFIMNGDTLTDLDLNLMYSDVIVYKSSIASFDNSTYTGTRLVGPFDKLVTKEYGCYWRDIGTPETLELARKEYAAIRNMPPLS